MTEGFRADPNGVRTGHNGGVSVERRPPRWSEAARMLGAAMTGLDAAMFGPKEERPGVVVDAPGAPPDDLGFDLLLDPEHPERSLVVFHAPEVPPGSDC
jgi:hypothetical protein